MEDIRDPRPLDPPEFDHQKTCPMSDYYKPTCECGDLKTDHDGEDWFCLEFMCRCQKFVLEKERCICEDE